MTKLTACVLTFLEFVHAPGRTITDDGGDPYLSRFYVTPDADWWRNRLPGVFLHYFHRGDNDRELHNHPWEWGFSFILTGGYHEDRLDRTTTEVVRKKVLPGDINRIDHFTFHRVDMLHPERGCWTIFVTGPGLKIWRGIRKVAFWGFLPKGGAGQSFELWLDRDERIRKTGTS